MYSVHARYQECLSMMYQRLPMYTRIGDAAYKTGLGHIVELCKRLDNPHQHLKCIHIGGTNGKGSCSHLLASVFQMAGYKTALYTSPHIHDFRERIKINGVMIPEEDVIQFMDQVTPWLEELPASFFEITVAMAFDYFAKQQVDIAIIEVGLGGLLDSTNIITPELSLITNISIDHTSLLGNSIEEIAIQKAGIIKENVPVIVSETDITTQKIFLARAFTHHAHITFADSRFEVVNREETDFGFRAKVVDMSLQTITTYEVGLKGSYQNRNLKAVLCCVDWMKLKGWKVSETALSSGLKQVKRNTGFYGRFDVMQQQPLVILDASHNEAGIQSLLHQVLGMKKNKLYIIMAFMRDKDLRHLLPLFPSQAFYFFTHADSLRALPALELKEMANEFGLKGPYGTQVSEGLEWALGLANDEDVVLVCGSFFILDEAYAYMNKSHDKNSKT